MNLVAVGVLPIKSLLNAVFVVDLALIIGYYSAILLNEQIIALKRVLKTL